MTLHRRSDRIRLRGTSVLAAPLLVLAVIGLSLAVASTIWVASTDDGVGAAAVAAIVVPGLVGVGALLAIRGCSVEIGPAPDGTGGEVRDVVAWVTVRRTPQARIATARVRTGPWRLYVLELDDGEVVKLVGASPQQFPARLLPEATRLDVEDLEALLGPDPA
ncbi:hypothetical protein [Dermatobacter hominis]|uniref:hypothetical protein n=1 Tax=Dermatobacter hominis TaxID=2884263 RepID=UPI001D10B178|nr:hypothetical protein [Dermatobacter hominis]UDY34235.1 hypothetical protein LH044_12895 [Dermatobacter hominis]